MDTSKKVTANEQDSLSSTFEQDLIALFSNMRDDIIKALNESNTYDEFVAKISELI